MGFFLLVLYLAAAYVRPMELYPWLASYRVMLCLGIAAAIVSVFGLFTGSRATFRAPQVYLMAAFTLAVILSLPLRGWFGGSLYAINKFGECALVYFLLVVHVTSWRRLRIVTVLVILLSSVLAIQGTLAYHLHWNEDLFVLNQLVDVPAQVKPEIVTRTDDHARDHDLGPPPPGRAYLTRIRGLGFLQDPNELAQALLVPVAFIWLGWRRGRWLRNMALVVTPILFFIYSMLLTRSRGGLLGLLAVALFFAKHRLGRFGSLAITGLLGCMLMVANFSGGREVFSLGAGTDRLAFWSEGLGMFKSNPILGVGFGEFMDYTDTTAHNSFVLCFAELGLTGYFLWLGLLFVTALELHWLQKLPQDPEEYQDIRRWAEALSVALYAFLVPALFLSRTYIVTLYMILGLATAFRGIARRQQAPVQEIGLRNWAPQVAALAAASIGLVYVAVNLPWLWRL